MNGVLVVDKPEGPTSHDVVARCRRVLGTRAIGHAGTLDPMATGVLVLVIGRATRLAQFLSGQPKSYDATLRLGRTTNTWDRTGSDVPCPNQVAWPGASEITACLSGFTGVHPQVPPPFSAKKVDGVRAYVLARRGQAAPVEPVMVELIEYDVLAVALPLVHIRLRCSAGYYVRSLVHELGRALGCGACLEALRRTASGAFILNGAVGLASLEEHPTEAAARIVPLERLLPDLPAVHLDEENARRVGHGNDITVPRGAAGLELSGATAVRLLAPDGSLLAVARPAGRPGVLHPAVVLK